MEQLLVGIGALGLAVGAFDGITRGGLLVVGAVIVLGYPFFEAHLLSGAVPWDVAFQNTPEAVRLDAFIRIAAAFLIPYAVVRSLFAFARRGGV